MIILIIIIFSCMAYISANSIIVPYRRSVYEADMQYFNRIQNVYTTNLIDANKMSQPFKRKNKISIITFDNRATMPYVLEHNKNITKYCKKWDYEYKFFSECSHNIYWCKIHMVLDELKTNKYDYVMWMDSDTYIFDMDKNLSDILNNYSSDIFIGIDEINNDKVVNAGVFVIKNTFIGIQFLQDCISSLKPECIKANGQLNGRWAASCYEQGAMNVQIADKYAQHTTILSRDIIYNYNACNKNVFILHYYGSTFGSSNDKRMKCFNLNYD